MTRGIASLWALFAITFIAYAQQMRVVPQASDRGVFSIKFSPSGNLYATSTYDGYVTVYNSQHNRVLFNIFSPIRDELNVFNHNQTIFAFAPNENHLISSNIKLYSVNIHTRERYDDYQLPSLEDGTPIQSVYFLDEETFIVSTVFAIYKFKLNSPNVLATYSTQHSNDYCKVSPSRETIAIYENGNIKLLNADLKIIRAYPINNFEQPKDFEFVDENSIVMVGYDFKMLTLDLRSGDTHNFVMGTHSEYSSPYLSQDGKYLIEQENLDLHLFEVKSKSFIKTLSVIELMSLSSDEATLNMDIEQIEYIPSMDRLAIIAQHRDPVLVDLATGRTINRLGVTPISRYIVDSWSNDTFRLVDYLNDVATQMNITTGLLSPPIPTHMQDISIEGLNLWGSDRRFVLDEGELFIYDTINDELIKKIAAPDRFKISSDRKHFFVNTFGDEIIVYDVVKCNVVKRFVPKHEYDYIVDIHIENDLIVFESYSRTEDWQEIIATTLDGNTIYYKFPGSTKEFGDFTCGQFVEVLDQYDTTNFLNISTGKLILNHGLGELGDIYILSESALWLTIISADFRTVSIYNVQSTSITYTLSEDQSQIIDAVISEDDRYIVTIGADGRISVWELKTGKKLYSLFSFSDGSWIAMAPDGRFDSSDGPAPNNAHYVLSTQSNSEIVLFNQVKSNEYYIPGLVEKIMNGTYQSGSFLLRDSPTPPLVEQVREGNSVKFKVNERGSGIGDVQIFLNGIEIHKYKSGEITHGMDQIYTFESDLQNLSYEVVAWNSTNTVSSPKEALKSKGDNETGELERADPTDIQFHAILVGSEKYIFAGLTPLRFACDDAVAMAKTLHLMATSSGVKPENIHITVLADDPEATRDLGEMGIRTIAPNKESWIRVCDNIKLAQLTPNDILFIFLSGHGTAVGGTNPDYIYLLPSARSGKSTDYDLLASRHEDTITGKDIQEVLRFAVEGKRAVVIDTCGAEGAQPELLTAMKSEVENIKKFSGVMAQESRSTQLIFGCPPDSASYEDPRFGHGILTYSLLFTLKNEETGSLNFPNGISVEKWFTTAKKSVSQFAGELNIKQEAGTVCLNSFYIGSMSPRERTAIQLPNEKHLITEVSLNYKNGIPADNFNALLENYILNYGSHRDSTIALVNTKRSPKGLRLRGTISENGDTLVIELILIQGYDNLIKTHHLPPINTSKESATSEVITSILNYLSSLPK